MNDRAPPHDHRQGVIFTLTVNGTQMLIEVDEMFGICEGLSPALGFSINAIDPDKPFPSERDP